MYAGKNSACSPCIVIFTSKLLLDNAGFIFSSFFFLGAVFTEGTKFAKMTHVRNSEQYRDNLIVQKAFGDICLAYQLHIRNELQNEKDQFHMEMQQQRENFEQEREQYKKRVKEALQDREKKEAELRAEVEDEKRRKKQEIDALRGSFDAEREDLKEKLRNAEQCECTSTLEYRGITINFS